MIVIPYRIGEDSENLGPTYNARCAACGKTGLFNLISGKVTLAIAFVPVAKGGQTWALQCPNCGVQLVLPELDAANAISLNRELMNRPSPEISHSELQALMSRFPLPSIENWLRANTNWICPQCKSEVPETFEECWNCGYLR